MIGGVEPVAVVQFLLQRARLRRRQGGKIGPRDMAPDLGPVRRRKRCPGGNAGGQHGKKGGRGGDAVHGVSGLAGGGWRVQQSPAAPGRQEAAAGAVTARKRKGPPRRTAPVSDAFACSSG